MSSSCTVTSPGWSSTPGSCPTDRFARVRSDFWKVEGSENGQKRSWFTESFQEGRTLAEVLPWTVDNPQFQGTPVCTAVPDLGVRTEEDLRPRLRVGLELAVETARAQVGLRSKVPRIAMPTFATKGGGGGRAVGSYLRVYLDLAWECAAEHGVDVVIACMNVTSFHGLQILRCSDGGEAWWPSLDHTQQSKATELAADARTGHLTPFLGSGVSVTSGLPDWAGLLENLRLEAGLDIPADEFSRLSTLDQADLLASKLQGELKAKIAEQTTSNALGLPPVLLASLPTSAVVTLNYDTLFEAAREIQRTALTVIPGGEVRPGTDWLLKLHGSTDRVQDIVLTRHDYLAYAASRSALSSIAVALLMTKHLLFVGFGFSDDHFHRLLHEVSSVYSRDDRTNQPGDTRRVGTALMIGHDRVREQLWGDQVTIVGFDAFTGGADSVPQNGRLLEIFLDMLVAYAVETPTYFLQADYAGMLTSAEHDVAAEVRTLVAAAEDPDVRPSVREAIGRLHRELGAVKP